MNPPILNHHDMRCCKAGRKLPKTMIARMVEFSPKFGEKPATEAQRHGKKSRNRAAENQNLPQLNVDDRGLNQDQNLFTTMNAVDHPFKNSVVSFRNRSS
jgi:hypothetical protein